MESRRGSDVALLPSEFLETILRQTEDGITVLDCGGQLVFANPAAARISGYQTPEELLAAPIADFMGRLDVFDESYRPLSLADLSSRQALTGGHPPATVVGFRNRFTGEEHWSLVHSTPVVEDGAVAYVVNVFRDITERIRAEHERDQVLEREREARQEAEALQQFFSFLAEASTVLASSLDYETTLASVAQLAVPHAADWCSILVVNDDGTVQQLAVAHVDPAKVELARELERRVPFDPEGIAGAPAVLRSGEPELIREIPEELLESILDLEVLQVVRDLGLRSSMSVPMIARERTIGVINLVAAESGRLYEESDLALAVELANRAALAVDNARLYRESQRTAAEQAAILEQMADGVIMADAGGTIKFFNRAAARMLGTRGNIPDVQRLVDRLQVQTDRGEMVPAAQSALGLALQGETVVNLERWVTRADGTQLFTQTSASPIEEENGTLLGAVAVFRDVTEQRRLEQQKDDFLSAAAHDLKTPMATVKGVAQMLQRRVGRLEGVDTAPVERGLDQIDSAIDRMTRLVNDLLDISRLQMGKSLELNREQTDLVALIRACVREARHTAHHHTIVVETSVAHIIGLWDPDRISRVLANLLTNAIKYTPDSGTITVSAALENGTATVAVRDRGIGIPEDEQQSIFDRFYRARNVPAQVHGTGIGLAGSRQIVEQHGGTISVQSRPDDGSTFTMRLPVEPS